MPPPSPEQRKKLLGFVLTVVGLLALVLFLNIRVHDRTAGLTEGVGTPRRAGLEKLLANPGTCAMTMEPSPDNERPMRHVNAGLIDRVDVLELGQSEADHVSQTFFKPEVHFYNGFVSNSYFVYQYEVFLDLMKAHTAPSLVLFDVRSGYILKDGEEPEWDTPAKSPLWWGFPPFHLGKAEPLPWYRDLPSLLSLAQTELTLTWVEHQLPHKPPPSPDGVLDQDTGEQFKCVSQAKKSRMYRWLADGSRVYQQELNGVLAAPAQIHLSEAIGDRHVNETRLRGLDFVLRKLRDAGSTVLVYSPPLHPRSYEEARQAEAIRAATKAIRAVTDQNGDDYCDLSFDAERVGCTAADFADEIHMGRHCSQQTVRELTRGCAPHAGPLLASKLLPSLLH